VVAARALEDSVGRRHINQFKTSRTSAMGSTGIDRLELHRALLWWVLVCGLIVYSCEYVHDAHICLLVFGDDEYWRASHFSNCCNIVAGHVK
jgi:hypothetical protein